MLTTSIASETHSSTLLHSGVLISILHHGSFLHDTLLYRTLLQSTLP